MSRRVAEGKGPEERATEDLQRASIYDAVKDRIPSYVFRKGKRTTGN
jgi:hypothetical protein